MRVYLVGFVALALISACTDNGGGGAEEPPATVTSNADTRTMTLPLDVYTVSPAEFQAIDNARQRLVSECARRFGFDWTGVSNTAPADTKPVKHEAQWGLTDEARARQYGYNSTPEEWPQIQQDARTKQRREQERQNAAPMSPALVAVLGLTPPEGAPPMNVPGGNGQPLPSQVNGQAIPAGGCFGEGDRALREGTTPDLDLNYPSQLAYEAENRTWADSRVVAKLEEWRTCMSQAGGFTYPTPIEAAADPKWRSEDHTAPPSEPEKAVAVADARCNRQAGLSDLAAAVDAGYHNEAIEKNSQQLEAARQAKDVVLRNAATVLAR